jgi:O-antigen/teichoic acid export membrane protein
MSPIERPSSNTLTRGAKGGAVALVGQAAQLIIQFVGTIVLARLLSPDDFGIFAMLTVFLGIGELIRDFGMPTAALQARSRAASVQRILGNCSAQHRGRLGAAACHTTNR